MTPETKRGRWSGLLLDLSPFRANRAFGRLWFGTALGSIGQEMAVVTVALQVYHLTSSTFAVALIAGIALGPMVVMGLYGGCLPTGRPQAGGNGCIGDLVGGDHRVDGACLAGRNLAVGSLHRRHRAAVSALRSVRDGVAYSRRASNIRFGLSIDLVAMALAQPRVLFPALGAVTLGGGVGTVGVLSAASAAGTVLSAFFSGWTGSVRREGFAILVVSYI